VDADRDGLPAAASVGDWLPDDHLARFVVEIVERLDLSGLVGRYRGEGRRRIIHPVLLALLIYGYATGTFSSRKIERATHDSVAFRFIAAIPIPTTTPGQLPTAVPAPDREPVRAGAGDRPGDELPEAGDHRPGRHEDRRHAAATRRCRWKNALKIEAQLRRRWRP